MSDREAEELAALEAELWREESRFDVARMEELLAPDFCEIGASGRRWSRAQTLAVAPRPLGAALPLPELRVRMLAPGIAQVLYVSRQTRDGAPPLRARRSSIWSREDGRWRLRFHQGTPLAE